MLDDLDLDIPESAPPPKKPSGNRTFLLVVGILGAIMVLALIAMVYYALVILPNQQEAAQVPTATAQLTETEIAKALQVTNTDTPTPTITFSPTATISPTPHPSNTPLASETPVTPIFSSTPGAGEDATATLNALLTQAALAQTQAATNAVDTATPTIDPNASATPSFTPTATSSALPQSGFADEVGAPGMLAAAVFLLLVVLVSRRLRTV